MGYDEWVRGEIGDDGRHPNSPNYVEHESVLDCPNETATWLAEHMAELLQESAIEIIAAFLAGPQDEYAARKLQRQFTRLAHSCEAAIHAAEQDARRHAA